MRLIPHPLSRPIGALVLAVVAGAALGGCGASSSADDRPGVRVLWTGDSIAGAEAPAVQAALEAAGVTVENATSDGGGNLVPGDHPVTTKAAAEAWKALKERIASFRPTVIAYQITTYDWGTARQQLAAYRKLAETAEDAGARLVLVSAPPFKIDDFYRPYAAAIKSAPAMAAQAAAGPGARFLDASELWGTDYAADKAQRSKDGIHSCQQGSAAFATWFAKRLGELAGFTPAPPAAWATGPWTDDERFSKLGCS
ncbi:SGNH hydrolase domain-containing protein [Nonomuraea fastidiosa]|jgi:lysophospholipase L1-like esterase|uniref:SGNH hydrolase domain-containing protein n=1 Tax=Nonomuraea TaxID=83681 RepID=UPI0032462319